MEANYWRSEQIIYGDLRRKDVSPFISKSKIEPQKTDSLENWA